MVANSWIPHPLSAEELETERRASAARLAQLHSAEARYSQTRSKETGHLLFANRVVFWTWFGRIFRWVDMPPEILSNILRFVIWSAPDPNAGVLWRTQMSSVCKEWRRITTADSTLWNAIWFRDPPDFHRSFLWYERSGTAAMDIRINDGPKFKFTAESMSRLLDRIIPKLSYIRMLIIVVEHWDPALVVLDRLRTAGQLGGPLSIERFEIHRTGSPYIQIGEGYQPTAFLEPIPLFGGRRIPSLKYVSINGVHLDWSGSRLDNLTTLDLRRMPLERAPHPLLFREMLQRSPGLNKLCLDGAGPQWKAEAVRHLTPVPLPELKILIIADFAVGYGLYVLQQISAPNVRDLTLMNFVGEDYTPFFTLITSAFPEVRILTIYSLELVAVRPAFLMVMVRWLQSMPKLAFLKIANVQKVFLDLFLFIDTTRLPHDDPNGEEPRRPICQKLQYLECQKVDVDLITEWIASRRRVGAALEKIYITRDLAVKIHQAQHVRLNSIARLLFLDAGARAPEEEILMRQ
ncbi:hypothetical protein BDN72DRAFT_753796 [Pluteus cervinus]|uniref:Uncharacterized protein n=1 Tax=Pluteus cervinus TaxID=181527 RepID=A0ACD3BI52_9AGAR|nr:hypothetical protein BDN72DRAFT_753796 [Pluteus cervinus]